MTRIDSMRRRGVGLALGLLALFGVVLSPVGTAVAQHDHHHEEVPENELPEFEPYEDDPPPRPRRRGRRGAAPTPPPAAAPEKEEEEPEEKEDTWLVITGGTIHTVSDGVITDGTILVKNGRIHEVGVDLPAPPDAKILPVDGLHVYPGLVAVDSQGLVTSPTGTDPFAFNMQLALAGGVTTARTGGHILKLTRGTLEGHALASSPFVTVRYTTRDPNGRRQLRGAFERIREFRRELKRHEEKKRDDPKLKDLDRKWIRGIFQTAERLMDRRVVAYSEVSEAGEIRDLCGLAEEFEFDLVLRGAPEAWIEATAVARSGASVIVTPRQRRDRDERRNAVSGGTIENASILHDHGVPVAIFPVGSLFASGGGVSLSGLAGRDMLNLPLEAAFAVRGGLSNAAAIRAITLDAAKILRVDHRIGSIEVGKDADFVITDGDLLHYLSMPQYTIVNGRIVYDQDEAGLLDHIRPNGDPEPQAPEEYWPRRLGEDF